jgi:hypothetical protein
LGDSMKKLLMFVPPAALAALLAPALVAHKAAAGSQPQVQPSVVLAAVDEAEAQRRAVTRPKAAAQDAAASLDKVAGPAGKIDPATVDPKLALNAVAR